MLAKPVMLTTFGPMFRKVIMKWVSRFRDKVVSPQAETAILGNGEPFVNGSYSNLRYSSDSCNERMSRSTFLTLAGTKCGNIYFLCYAEMSQNWNLEGCGRSFVHLLLKWYLMFHI